MNQHGHRGSQAVADREQNSPAIPLEGTMAPPRKNGELIFEAPWESRALGMAVALHAEGAFPWDGFSRRLAEHLAHAGPATAYETVLPVAPETDSAYYKAWVAALEDVLTELGTVSAGELATVVESLAAGD